MILFFIITQSFAAQVGSSQAVINCDSFCKEFGSTPGLHNALTGRSGSWSSTDDTICDELGVPTAATSLSLATSTATVAAAPARFAASTLFHQCSLPFGATSYQALQTLGLSDNGAMCSKLGTWKTQCQYENSQVEVDCIAYNQLVGQGTGAKTLEGVMLGLDITTAALCGTACTLSEFPLFAATFEIICGSTAIAAGATELAEALSMGGSQITDYLSMAGGGVGLAGGIASVAGGASKAHSIRNTPAPEQGAEGAEDKNKTLSKQACGTALVFAALAGIRSYEISIFDQTAKNQCKTIQDLISSGSSSSTSSITPNPVASFSVSKSTSVASSSTSGSPGDTVTGSTTTPTGTQMANFQSCLRGSSDQSVVSGCAAINGIPLSTIAQSSAADAQHLTQSGVLPQMLAQTPNLGAVTDSALKNGPAATLAGMSGTLGGSLATSLSDIAQAAEKNGAKLAAALKMESTYSGGGGRTPGNSTPAAANNPFALFQTGGAAGGTVSLESFRGIQEPKDIWHIGTQMNIFEIISNRVEKIAPYVTIEENP